MRTRTWNWHIIFNCISYNSKGVHVPTFNFILLDKIHKILIMKLIIFTIVLCTTSYIHSYELRPEPEADNEHVHVGVTSETGKQYNLKLTKPDKHESVLDPNIKIIGVSSDSGSGSLRFDTWEPSHEQRISAENVYIDKENFAAVRLSYENGERTLEGVVDGMKFMEESGKATLVNIPSDNRSDYVNVARPQSNKDGQGTIKQSDPVDAVVEVVIVCDKEFGDVFQHNRQKILDYFTVYFWDINLRYKTLPSSNVSFRITGIIVISSTSGQPFIEESRNDEGAAIFGKILDKFSYWVYAQMNSLPKFDMAVAITNTKMEWYGGIAYVGTTCFVNPGAQKHLGTLVFNDGGDWGSLRIGAHEMAHSLKAPHDDDSNYPGGCQDRGYIMSGGNDDLSWFFSTCSDRTIGEFVRSENAACLRRLDESSNPPVDPSYSAVLAPSMQIQCQTKLKNSTAFVKEDQSTCKAMKCWLPNGVGWTIWSFAPVDNTPCTDGAGEGRCFRGRCRKPGNLIVNVASGKCLRATNPFTSASQTVVDLVNCPRPGTPLDRFIVENGDFGQTYATPFSSPDGKTNGEKCIYTGNGEGTALWTETCDPKNTWHGWDQIDVGNGEFLLSHRVTKKCAKPNEIYVSTYANCDKNDRNMKWKLQ